MPPPEPCPSGHGTERTEANNRGNMLDVTTIRKTMIEKAKKQFPDAYDWRLALVPYNEVAEAGYLRGYDVQWINTGIYSTDVENELLKN